MASLFQILENQYSQEQQNSVSTHLSTDTTFSLINTCNKEQFFDSSYPNDCLNEEYPPQHIDIKRSPSESSTLCNLLQYSLHDDNSKSTYMSQIDQVYFDNQDNNIINQQYQQQESFSMINPPVDQNNQFNYYPHQQYQQYNYTPYVEQNDQNYDVYLNSDSNVQAINEEVKNPNNEWQEYLTNPQSENANIFEHQNTASCILQIKSDKDQLVRHRSKITHRRLPHSNEIVVVQERTLEKKKQFKNHFKNFLKKAIPYLIKKLEEFNAFDEDYDVMLQILESFQNKTSKDDILFLVKNFQTLEEEEFNRLSQLNNEQSSQASIKEQKINPDFRILLFAISHIENSDSYERYKHILSILRNLNAFNRKWLLRFTMVDYIPNILRIKANKQDQFFTNNYIKHVLTNTAIIE